MSVTQQEQRALDRARALEIDPRTLVVFAGCAWEMTAIASGRIPTITAVWHRMRVRPVGRLWLWLALGYLLEHLFGENR